MAARAWVRWATRACGESRIDEDVENWVTVRIMKNNAAKTGFVFSLAIGLGIAFGPSVHADLDRMSLRVPASANALAVVDADAVLATPMSVRGGWHDKIHPSGHSGTVAAPPRVEMFLIAAEMDFEFMQPLWEIAAADMADRVDMEQVAKNSGGRRDRLAGSEAVERPNDTYVVAFGPQMVAAMAPANRPKVMRWVRDSKSKRQPDLSPYLAASLEAAKPDATQIVLALDLEGLLAEGEVADHLAESTTIKKAGIDHKEAAKTMSTLAGIRLEIAIGNSAAARLRMTFADGPGPLADVAKDLLVEILADRGARINDIVAWSASVEQNDVVLSGELSASGLRRVHSILSAPVGPWANTTSGSGPDPVPSEADSAGVASRSYFQAVTGYLNDLLVNNVEQIQSLHQVALWVNRYARRIEELDATGVDPMVVAYGEGVVVRLREIGHVIEAAERRADVRDATNWNFGRSRYGRYGAYGYYEKPGVTRDRAVAQAEEASRGLVDAQAIVGELHALTNETRARMTQKYGLEF